MSHLQTNGKVEKLFDEFEKKVKFFSSLEEWMNWYNAIRSHRALDLKTSYQAYYAKMPQYESLTDPSKPRGRQSKCEIISGYDTQINPFKTLLTNLSIFFTISWVIPYSLAISLGNLNSIYTSLFSVHVAILKGIS